MTWFDAVGQMTNRVNFALARARLGRLHDTEMADIDELLADVVSTEPNPVLLGVYLSSVFWAWSLLTACCGFLVLGFAFIGDKVDGSQGDRLGVAIGMLPFAACIVGGVDVIWRQQYADAASRRFTVDRTMDRESIRLIRLARRNHATLLLQAAAGVAVAVVVAMWG